MIARWRASDLSLATVPVEDVQIARKQPRPLSPRRTCRRIGPVAPVPRRETRTAIFASIGGTAPRRCKEGPLFSGLFTVSSVRFEH